MARVTYQTRILPPDEWPRLAGTELETGWPVLDPANAQIVVVEDGDRIVGCWSVLRYVHVEGVWIHPDYRGRSRVAAYLLRGMRQAARSWGARAVLTAALTDQVRSLIAHLGGVQLPGDHYVMPLGGEDNPCQ